MNKLFTIFRKVAKPFLFLLLTQAAQHCSSIENINPKQTIQGIKISEGKAQLLRFPLTYHLHDETPVIILTEPLLFKENELWEGKATRLIPWLNSRGMHVYLVRLSRGTERTISNLTAALSDSVKEVREISGSRKIILGGISGGGQAVLSFMLTRSKQTREVDRVFFLGTGFDYDYPGSFVERVTGGSPWSAKCANHSRGRTCESIYLHSQEQEGVKLSGSPFNIQKDFHDKAAEIKSLHHRALFLGGKIDPVAPTETYFKTFRDYGANSRSTVKQYFAAGEDNFLSEDYDHAMLFASDDAADEVYPVLLKFINDTD